MTKNLLIIFTGILLASAVIGCQGKRGCTDSYSDNYDPEAKLDDDTCVPTRDKFVGEYDANGTTSTDMINLSPFDQVVVNIVDSTATTPTGLIIGVSNFDAQLYALSAVVVGTYNLSVTRQSLGAYTYWGEGSISGRVLDLEMTRLEEVAENEFDTLYLHLYGIKEIEE